MARIKPGVPTVKEIREGESEYRYIHGTGLVLYTRYSNQIYSTKMHAASTPPVMDKKLEMAIGDRIGASIEGDEFIKADGTVQFTGNQSHGGHDITGVNDLDVNGDIDVDGTSNLDNTDIDGTLDVDGATTLDQTTINTTDGDFRVTGPNDISFVTTGTSMDTGIVLDSSLNFNMDVTRNCDWNTDAVDWDNSSTFVLTSVGNITIETSGADTDKTIKLFNDNNHASSFHGIHLKTDAQNTGSCRNNILIECANRAAKGGGIGVDILSEDGIRLRGEDANNGDDSLVLIRATGSVDIGGGTTSISQTALAPNRTKIHGPFDISNLYRSDATVPIVMDVGTTLDGTATGVYTKFEALDTYKLMRAMTARVTDTIVFVQDSTCDTENGSSTVDITNTGNPSAAVISDGMKVTGAGIPSNTYVTSKATSEFELRNVGGSPVNATDDGTNVTLSFYNHLSVQDDDYIGIVSPISDGDDDAIGTVWQVTVTYSAGGTQYGQIWYCAKQNGGKISWLSSDNGEALAAADKGIVTWTTANGIRWQNATGSTMYNLRASALRIQSGTLDF